MRQRVYYSWDCEQNKDIPPTHINFLKSKLTKYNFKVTSDTPDKNTLSAFDYISSILVHDNKWVVVASNSYKFIHAASNVIPQTMTFTKQGSALRVTMAGIMSRIMNDVDEEFLDKLKSYSILSIESLESVTSIAKFESTIDDVLRIRYDKPTAFFLFTEREDINKIILGRLGTNIGNMVLENSIIKYVRSKKPDYKHQTIDI